MALLLAEMILALLAVFGLYAAVRLLAATAFLPRALSVCLELDRTVDEEEAAHLLSLAREACFFRRCRVVVLIDATLPNAAPMRAFFEDRGATCYFVKKGG